MKLPHFLLFCACASLAGLAVAQSNPRGPSGERGRNLEREFAPGLGRDRFDEREPQREQRYQMSPEERRQLRRDVNDAGRELYGRPGRPDRLDRSEPLQP